MNSKSVVLAAIFAVLVAVGCGRGPVASGDSSNATISASFSISATTINAGDSATLTWSTVSATSVSIDQGVGNVAVSGTKVVSPAATTTYTLTASSASGTVSKSVTVTVNGSQNPPPPPGNISGVLMWKNDRHRIGLYDDETRLTPANVSVSTFGQTAEFFLDGLIMAQPLYVSNLDLGAAGVHNVVIAATEHDSVYAFDADTNTQTPLWTRNFLSPGATTMPDNYGGRSTFDGEVGITGTPVIDPQTGYMYFVSAQTNASGADEQWLHAIDIRSGRDVLSGTTKISASVTGDGEASVNGQIAFDPSIANQRPGLLLFNGIVYIAWGSFSDRGQFHGWVMAYDSQTLQQIAVFNSATQFLANDIGGDHGGGASFWAGGAGMSADDDGNIYIVSGDGSFNADQGGSDYGDSILKLKLVNNNFQVADWFSTFDQECINAADIEMGSGGVALLPDSAAPGRHLALSTSKEGRLYLLDTDNMGHFNSAGDTQIYQTFMVGYHQCVLGQTTGAASDGAGWNRLYGNPSFWNNNIYMGASNQPLMHYSFSAGKLSPTPTSTSSFSCGNRGCNTVVSSNGTSNAIVWAYEKSLPNGYAILHALDATNLAKELWNSNMNETRDGMLTGIGFGTPIVANSHVYTAWHRYLVVYGSLN